VVEQPLRINSLGRILDEAGNQEFVQFRADLFGYGHASVLSDLGHGRVLVQLDEGWLPRNQFDHRAAERPDVWGCLRIITVLVDDLGRYPKRWTRKRVLLVLLRRHAEVRQLDHVLFGHEQVGRFYVTVDYWLRMYVEKTLENLAYEGLHSWLR
jgi:hypothetical protein